MIFDASRPDRLRRLQSFIWHGPAGLDRSLTLEWQLVTARWSAVVFVGVGLLLAKSDAQPLLAALGIVSLGALFNLAIQTSLPRRPGWFTNGYLTTIGDCLLSIALVRLLGDSNSGLSQVFFIVTVAAALRVGYGPSLVVASVFSVAQLEQRFSEVQVIDGPFIVGPVFLCLTAVLASFVRRQARTAETGLLLERLRQSSELNAALTHQSLHDALTGLANRGLLHRQLLQILPAANDGGPSVALLLLDLDRFKDVNDTLGHHVGDVLLQQIGQRLQGAVRSADLVTRLGGDEFAVLLPGGGATEAAHLAEVLAHVLEAAFVLEGQPIAINASIGIAVAPDHGRDADTLLRCADVAMYQAKRSGTGVAVYSVADDRNQPERLAVLGELRTAIDHNELLLHYQPKLDLRSGSLVGVEALVRWQHPQRGFLPPGEFIPLAEQTGLIYPLTRWLLNTALAQQRLWREAGLDIPVAVNLSRRTLHDPQLPEMVAEALTRWDVPPTALVLEITESSLMADPVRAGDNLEQLSALGVRLSIDDFGTGYSSLASLKNLPVDELKIDQSFVQAMATDADSRAIVRATIDLADALNLRVVAEGVEDRTTWDVLAGLGCDIAQGYFVSRPIAAVALEDWIRTLSPTWLAIADQSRLEDAVRERIRGRGARQMAEEEFIARKRAEVALQASEERNRLTLQAAGMGTWDWDVMRDVHTWSSETEALHGLGPGTFGGAFAAFEPMVHPDDWAGFRQELRMAAAERRDSVACYRAIWPDGSEHWIENRGHGLYAADGKHVRVTGTSLDITARKHAEAALRASEERTRAAIHACRMGAWERDVLHNTVSSLAAPA